MRTDAPKIAALMSADMCPDLAGVKEMAAPSEKEKIVFGFDCQKNVT